jgi:transposase
METYPADAVERAMTMYEVILRVKSRELTVWQAAEILDCTERTVRRYRRKIEQRGYKNLFDRRRRLPSPKRAPAAEVGRLLELYRTKYMGFTVKHFHDLATRDDGVTLSYSFAKKVLQDAKLVKKRKPRGKHRLRRQPRACFGEMLHLDGSEHAWLALCPDERQTMIAILDDATKRLLYAQLHDAESTATVLAGLRDVIGTHGIPMALYTDRARWAFITKTAGGRVEEKQRTQVGRALAKLGVEHIPSYSPQARGRGERLNRTLQDRLVNELRLAGIRTVEAANRYLREKFIPDYEARFARAPRDPASAFVPVRGVDLDQVLCHEEERTVGQDNVVGFEGKSLQLAKQPGRRSCAGMRVLIRRHIDAGYSVWRGTELLGHFDAKGRAIALPKALLA